MTHLPSNAAIGAFSHLPPPSSSSTPQPESSRTLPSNGLITTLQPRTAGQIAEGDMASAAESLRPRQSLRQLFTEEKARDTAERITWAPEIYRLAACAEKKLTPALQAIAETTGGQMMGLEFRLKTVDSIEKRIRANPYRIVDDAVRYTVAFPESTFTAGALKTLERLTQEGYKLVKVWNKFKEGADYKGVNTFLETPNCQFFEVQFHTPASYAAKLSNHHIYEQYRQLQRKDPQRKILEQQMSKNSALVPVPEGASRII